MLVGLAFVGLVPLAGFGSNGSSTVPFASNAAVAKPAESPAPPVSTAAHAPALRAPVPTAPTAPSPAADPSSVPLVNAAPASSAEFNHRRQVIAIAFPLPAGSRYRYRDNYADIRPGPVEDYNHVFDVRNGRLRRAHDGIDIYAPRGTAVLAPFDGLVIKVSSRWRPWQVDRYGTTVAIVSTDPATAGYVALLCHLDEKSVVAGERVTDGQVVGTLGNTGNAVESHAQLHFELRAPFLIEWPEDGGKRLVDAFNPYPSLIAADPSRSN